MIVVPPFLKRFQKEAKECLALGYGKKIEFSRGTYQVEIEDPISHETFWIFLQFDERGRLKDHLCSCSQSESGRGCLHQAIAFFHVHSHHNTPLHTRFERSLWNKLCFQYALNYPEISAESLKTTDDETYIYLDSNKKPIFSIKAPLSDIKTIILEREPETEENSLKFSNLPLEELTDWQEGQISPQLSYELSFWSDLAKWLFSMQEAKISYEISFKLAKNKVPNGLKVSFPDVIINWLLPENILIEIIQSLKTVKSPLSVHYILKSEIEHITYDEDLQTFCVVATKDGSGSKHQGITLGEWTYIPDDGFYLKKQRFPSKLEELSEVEKNLNEHSDILKSLLVDCVVRENPISVSYQLFFDENKNLHIIEYLFTPGDLSSSCRHTFGSWVYMSKGDHHPRGFYNVEERLFSDIETIIPPIEIPNFIAQHRTWLNSQEGFKTHLKPIETDLSYCIRENGSLLLTNRLTIESPQDEIIEFDRWAYIPKEGFYYETGLETNLHLYLNVPIPPDQIPLFISRNKEELLLIENFFTEKCPITKTSLKIEINQDGEIEVIPQYDPLPAYKGKKIFFFDGFTYIDGEGFYELPTLIRLPEKFSHHVTIEASSISSFIEEDLDKLTPYITFIDPRLCKAKKKQLVANSIELIENDTKHNYALQLDYQTELGTLSLDSLWHSIHQDQKFIFSNAGLIDLSDKQFAWLKTLKKHNIEKKQKKLRLSTLELLRLNAFDEIVVAPGEDPPHKNALALFKQLTEFQVPEEPNIRELKSQLRPYQMIGVHWLWFLYRHGLSGLLCDDMGLGKTHQAMALIAACKHYWKEKKKKDSPIFLIVCPTSVIYHWQEKIHKYLPKLKVWTFHGSNRDLSSFAKGNDVLLTSYGIWRNEIKALSGIKFEIAIFDELQIAKNQTSRIYHTLLKANVQMRLGMTGTPIENRLRELKTLFDLILPSYMPSDQDYRNFFIRPIEKGGDQSRKSLLSRLIKPFVLRRKKEDVLLDLPEKIEEIAHCDLSPDQQSLYIQVLASSREKILDELNDNSVPIPYIHIFALLANLKQICDHPAAFLKEPENYKNYTCGKWNLFIELLEEARESGQKVVVFSQYLNMLDIIELYLNENSIGYATIRGSTTNRGAEVARFNTDKNCEVFVASLQAAGLGIDLTAASVVIHYDRWWNAAKEKQATDRVHRIGQTRGVQVFKLITKGTLEEHIDAMIEKKTRLLEDVIGTDNYQVMKKFDRQEMIELFQAFPTEEV